MVDLASTDEVQYLIYGKEVGEQGTPHFQGFLIFTRPTRFNRVKRLLGREAHIEAANGRSDQAADYCKKDDDYEEFGELPGAPGRRSDLEEVTEWSDEYTRTNGHPPTDEEFAKHFPTMHIKYGQKLVNTANLRAPPPVIRTGTPRTWQQALEDELSGPADDRKVIFYVDARGGEGKSWFQGYYISTNPARTQLLGIGKRDDIAYAIDERKEVFFFNIPRRGMPFLQYTILEQLKDRVVFSTKYQSKTKVLYKHPHVVVFCNEHPDLEAMSHDRFDIRVLGEPLPAMDPGLMVQDTDP